MKPKKSDSATTNVQQFFSHIQANWTVLVVASLGASLCFNIGYFFSLFGNNPFLVSIEDLSKSFIYILSLYVVLQNVVYLFQDLHEITAKWAKVLVIVVGFFATLIPPIVDLYHTLGTQNNTEYYNQVFSLVTRGLALLTIALLIHAGVKQSGKLSIEQMLSMLLLTFAVAYSFGIMTFYADCRKMQEIQTVNNTDEKSKGYLLTTRTQFIIQVDSANCKFEVFPIDKIRIIRVTLPAVYSAKNALDHCFK